MLNYDGLMNAPKEEVSKAAFVLANKVTSFPPHMQAAASAVLFLLVCEAHRTKPQDVFTATKNLLASDVNGENPHFAALRMYLKYEQTK
jgi:hypothetical protein